MSLNFFLFQFYLQFAYQKPIVGRGPQLDWGGGREGGMGGGRGGENGCPAPLTTFCTELNQ